MTQREQDGVTAAEEAEPPAEKALEPVSLSDFEAIDYEAPLAESKKHCCASLGTLYRKAAETAKQQGDGAAARVYGLLADVTQIHFKPYDRAEPYGPMMVVEGRRSIIPDDVHGEQSAIFAKIAPAVRNAGLRARLADIAWLNDRSDAASAQLAIRSFREVVQLVVDGKAELYFEDERASSHAAVELLRRACQIASATGWKEPEAGKLKALIGSITQSAFDERDPRGYLDIAELNANYGISEPVNIAGQAATLAEAEEVDPQTSRELWELAAGAYRQGGSEDDYNRCLTKAAECYVSMAAAASFKGMTAASWLMDAIKALRRIPGTKARRQELETKLREAQASISDEMGVVSTELDLSKIVDHARKVVSGLTLAQAFAEFARLEASPSPDTLREQAIEQANENPLSSIIPMAIHDDEGKLVAKSPGLIGEDGSDTGMKYLIARHEAMRRHLTASGMIEPARRRIFVEHPLHTRHFGPLVSMSPFVPAGHEDLYALGFARFFAGDFISALHILVPQLENSLRHVLKQAAIDPSSIQSDMTQESRTISVMLDKDRTALEKIFGSAITLEIENLFDFRGGPALRHQLVHGLMSASACEGPDAIYACWFVFRLCCLPLFRHWQHVAAAYEDL
jgi:hypothetical protein